MWFWKRQQKKLKWKGFYRCFYRTDFRLDPTALRVNAYWMVCKATAIVVINIERLLSMFPQNRFLIGQGVLMHDVVLKATAKEVKMKRFLSMFLQNRFQTWPCGTAGECIYWMVYKATAIVVISIERLLSMFLEPISDWTRRVNAWCGFESDSKRS